MITVSTIYIYLAVTIKWIVQVYSTNQVNGGLVGEINQSKYT